MKLTEELKKQIETCFNENKTCLETIKELKISRATYYRIIKEIKNKSILEVIDTESSETSETKKDNKSSDDSDNENDTETIKNNSLEVFDKEDFKKQLNESLSESSDEIIEVERINPVKEEIKRPMNDSVSNISVSFAKPIKKYNNNNVSNIINKSNIMDTIKNCPTTGTIDELKQKRSTIIIIRQYINTFPEELKNIYIVKNTFEKRLYTMSLDQLNVILEDVRISLSLSRNKNIFMHVAETSLRGFENISKYSGYDVSGLTDELLNDPDFIIDLQIISCEVDVSKFVNPKTSAIFKVIKKSYEMNQKNKVNGLINDVMNNKDKLEKIINLSK